ncbi:MAG: metallophosphoesterase [Pyramidobacter sp.]|jgi:predicted MPP superfamily phosphohydrolase
MNPFYLAPLLLSIYVGASALLPLKLPLWGKATAAVFLLGAAYKNVIFQKIGGGMYFAPDLPRGVLMGGALAFNFLAAALFPLMLKDVIHGLWRLSLRRPFPSQAAALWALSAAAVLALWGTWQACALPRVVNYEVAIAGLPPEFDGKTAALLSDLHCSPTNGRDFIQAVVDRTRSQNPDLILMTGDFVDGRVERLKGQLEPLSQLKAPLGIYGCTGNHEYLSGYGQWRPVLKSLGIRVLENEHAVLEAGRGRLVIAGVNDPLGAAFGFEKPDVEKTLQGTPADAPVVLLRHRPSGAPESARYGASLQLSGHTHGGHLPLLRPLVARLNGGYVRGWYDVEGMKLFTSPGTSQWNGFPMRLGCPSEISVLTLRSAAKR